MTAEMVDEHTVRLVKQLLAETREELNRADGKAAMLFAIFGIGYGAVLAGVIAGHWTPSELTAAAEVIWWLGAVSALMALTAVAAAVWPRLDNVSATGRVTYFGHVVGYRSREALMEALDRQAQHEAERPVEQLQAISEIVMSKYKLVRAGLVLYGFGAVTCAVAVLAS